MIGFFGEIITPTVSGMENENDDGDMRHSNNDKEYTDNVSNNFNDTVNRENPNQDQSRAASRVKFASEFG